MLSPSLSLFLESTVNVCIALHPLLGQSNHESVFRGIKHRCDGKQWDLKGTDPPLQCGPCLSACQKHRLGQRGILDIGPGKTLFKQLNSVGKFVKNAETFFITVIREACSRYKYNIYLFTSIW